jgi:hypothetical protein
MMRERYVKIIKKKIFIEKTEVKRPVERRGADERTILT